MFEKKLTWHRVAPGAEAIDWNDRNLAVVQAGGKIITLIRIGDHLYACAHKCPHAGGILADGFIDKTGSIVCPLHRYRFNVSNGHNVSGEGYRLKTYPTEQREDGIYVGLEAGGLFPGKRI